MTPLLTAPTVPLSEASAKAAFLYNLTKFVEWPANREASSFVVCVAQGSPIDEAAPRAFAGKTVGGQPVEVRRVRRPAQVGSCDVLFLGGDNAREIRPMLNATRQTSTLTVGDSTALLDLNGMISIVLVDFHLELHINRESLQASGLQLAPQLLRLVKERKSK